VQTSLVPWMLAAAATLVGSLLELSGGQRMLSAQAKRWRALPLGAGLAALLSGIVWRAWIVRGWPGTTTGETLALVAGGALLLTLWPHWGKTHRERGLAWLASAAMIIAATIVEWWRPLVQPVPQALTWLFGLRSVLVGIGLGGWLDAFASSVGAFWPDRHDCAPAQSLHQGLEAGYPWLTAALVLEGLWDLAAYAVVWRGTPAEIWLLVACLVGYIYLQTARLNRTSLAGRWLAGPWAHVLLAFAGLT
jgi:hypothetical protein